MAGGAIITPRISDPIQVARSKPYSYVGTHQPRSEAGDDFLGVGTQQKICINSALCSESGRDQELREEKGCRAQTQNNKSSALAHAQLSARSEGMNT